MQLISNCVETIFSLIYIPLMRISSEKFGKDNVILCYYQISFQKQDCSFLFTYLKAFRDKDIAQYNLKSLYALPY